MIMIQETDALACHPPGHWTTDTAWEDRDQNSSGPTHSVHRRDNFGVPGAD